MFYIKTATEFYSNLLCVCIVLPNFNHRMHTCTWSTADKPFIKQRCYVMLYRFSQTCMNSS